MSLVIAAKKGGAVYFGADTQTTYGKGAERRAYTGKENLKVMRLPNGMILGRVGRVHSLQYVWAHPEWFTLPADGVLTKRHIVMEIVPQIYRCYRDNELFEEDGKEAPLSTGDLYLLAHRDKLFMINDRLGVTVIETHVAIGAGEDFVYYGLENMNDGGSVQTEIKKLLRLGVTCCPSVGAPFAFVDTLTGKIKIEG